MTLLALLLPVTFCFAKESSRYQVTCADPSACPEYIAGVAIDHSAVCSAVLVKSDVIATNLHCIPKDIRQEGASCGERISFHFPKTRTREEATVGCDKILTISSPIGNTPLTPDYAFVRIAEKSDRTPALINTSGFDDNETVHVFKVDPEKTSGVVRRITCKAAQASMLNPLFLSKQSPVVGLSPCSIVQGNSGSPIFSEGSELKGLISAKGLPSDTSLKSEQNFEVAYGSNFYCLNVPALGLSNTSKECHEAISEEAVTKATSDLVRNAVEPVLESFNKKVSEQFESLHKQTKFFLQWEVSQKDETFTGNEKLQVMTAIFKPKCLLLNHDALKHKNKTLRDTTITYDIKYSTWGMELHLDPQGRPVPLLVSKESAAILSFSPKDLLKDTVSITFNNATLSVPFCP